MVAARVSIGAIFFLYIYYKLYSTNIVKNKDTVKRYKFMIVTKRFLNFEKELILFEKYAKDKYII
jgi:hypothetical protein